jgi:hypothetical protein
MINRLAVLPITASRFSLSLILYLPTIQQVVRHIANCKNYDYGGDASKSHQANQNYGCFKFVHLYFPRRLDPEK